MASPSPAQQGDPSLNDILGDLRAVLRGRGSVAPLEAVTMSRDLSLLVAQLEAAAVIAARQDGVTWEQIGRSLAVPRQNVHRRFGGRCYRAQRSS